MPGSSPGWSSATRDVEGPWSRADRPNGCADSNGDSISSSQRLTTATGNSTERSHAAGPTWDTSGLISGKSTVRPRMTSPMLTGRSPRFSDLICARICARDATGRVETWETQRTRHERPPSVRRGQRGDQRPRETPETHVVWLITQRSRVQIPPPLPRPEALSRTEKGPSACGLLTDVLTKRPLWTTAVDVSEPPMISSASVLATTWPSASRSVWTYCFMLNSTSEWPIRWLSAFQSILAFRPAVAVAVPHCHLHGSLNLRASLWFLPSP